MDPDKTATTVLAVRHAVTATTGAILPGQSPGLHLNDVGVAQAQNTANTLGQLKKITAVYASPLERAAETAAVIATTLGLSVVPEPDLIECNFGDWTGQKISELSQSEEWRQMRQNSSNFRFPGGESYQEMQTRATAAIERLVKAHRGETIAVVTHADVIKVLVASALSAPLESIQKMEIATASVSAITFADGQAMVRCVGLLGKDWNRMVS